MRRTSNRICLLLHPGVFFTQYKPVVIGFRRFSNSDLSARALRFDFMLGFPALWTHSEIHPRIDPWGPIPIICSLTCRSNPAGFVLFANTCILSVLSSMRGYLESLSSAASQRLAVPTKRKARLFIFFRKVKFLRSRSRCQNQNKDLIEDSISAS